LQNAHDFLTKYNITNGHLYDSVARLELYANYYDFLKIAYSEPDSKKLKDIYVSLSNEVLAHNRESDKSMVETLNGVITKYDQFNHFISDTLPKYGTVKGDNYEIDPSIQDLSHLLDSASELKEFPVIDTFIGIVNKQRDDIVKNNKSYQEKKNFSYRVWLPYSENSLNAYIIAFVRVFSVYKYEKRLKKIVQMDFFFNLYNQLLN